MPCQSSTRPRRAVLSSLLLGFISAQCLVPHVSATTSSPEQMEQGFLFDWFGNQSPPNPTVTQCQTLPLSWGRNGATGPNPAAPYYLQIYTSTFVVPLVIRAGDDPRDTSFDWPMPFVPDTQFMLCMFASNNVTGGCQTIATVYQDRSLTEAPTCRNFTYPQPSQVLGVDIAGPDGTWSQFGWVPQCSDITMKPTNGTPPYTYTISPALRPPINFTSDSMDQVAWTNTLASGLPFWVTISDSTGMAYTQGPVHSAGGGSTACLVEQKDLALVPGRGSSGLSRGGVAGVAIGTLIAGLVAGTLGALFFLRPNGRGYTKAGLGLLHRKSSSEHFDSAPSSRPPFSTMSSAGSSRHRGGGGGGPNDIDPYVLDIGSGGGERLQGQTRPGHAYTTSSGSSVVPTVGGGGTSAVSPTTSHPSTTTTTTATTPARSPIGGGSHVYVVHHDGGRAPPVTVFTSDGTEVVELPPQYENAAEARRGEQAQNTAAAGRGGFVPPDAQRRQPRELPRKPPLSPTPT